LLIATRLLWDILVERGGHRKTQTEAELIAVINESERGLPSIRLWISEGLEGLARRIWVKRETRIQ
jgi:hypothetical protein